MKIKKDEEEDISLFRQAMQDVNPLVCDVVPLTKSQPYPYPKQRRADELQVRYDMLSDHYDPAELETGEELLFARPGVQHTLLHKLRRGQLSIKVELDLHGMIVPVARIAVARFLGYCCANGVRCARIVHGKGYGSWQKQPVLKAKVNKWLQQREEVLAFCSARPVDGGTGAIYVLIKQKRLHKT